MLRIDGGELQARIGRSLVVREGRSAEPGGASGPIGIVPG
jgi:hypothetical protein